MLLKAKFWVLPVMLLGPLLFGPLGCHEKRSEATGSGTAAVSGAASTRATADPKKPRLTPLPGGTVSVLEGLKPRVYQVPLEPVLGIFRGQGVGAIRFGATVETIERLMSAKCTVKTADVCNFAAHAIDFYLKDGVLAEVRIHGDERAFSDKPGDTYGVFNGRFPGGAALGMYPQFVTESLGEPSRVEKVTASGKFPTVERHYFGDDLVLEYDTLENGNVVLAGINLKASSTPEPPQPPRAPTKK
jgi:hypothetical protein